MPNQTFFGASDRFRLVFSQPRNYKDIFIFKFFFSLFTFCMSVLHDPSVFFKFYLYSLLVAVTCAILTSCPVPPVLLSVSFDFSLVPFDL